MIEIASGHAAIDRFLADGYERVLGMSSRFAAAICGHLIRRQSELGITGGLVEIGTFEGRFFIAMALGLTPGEARGRHRPLRLAERRRRGALPRQLRDARHRARALRLLEGGQPRDHRQTSCSEKLGQQRVRFAHIDSHHSRECLTIDLELMHPLMHAQGVICLDDMLHPGYPMMACAVFDYFARHPEMRLLAIIDREDIVAAPKFLICRAEALERYQNDMMAAFARFHFTLGADMESYSALVLTPNPRLAEIE